MYKLKTTKLPNGYKKIVGFPKYGINKNGEVFSLITGRNKTSWINMRGYREIGLQNKNGKTVFRTIHTLLMLTYNGKRPKGFDICHNDGNKLNNNLDNLRYDTRRNNILDKEKHGVKRYGEKINTAKLKEKDVIYIVKNYKRIHRTKSNSGYLAKKFGVTKTSITNIIAGKTWTHMRKELEEILK